MKGQQLVIDIDEKTDRRLVYLVEMKDEHLECVTPDGVAIQVPRADLVYPTGWVMP